MAFVIPQAITPIESAPEPIYSSGFTPEEEERIILAKLTLEKRDLQVEPVTLEEFTTIVVPWFRIHRTQEFMLHPEKVKTVRVPREPKAKVPKEPKPKRLTKAQSNAKFTELVFKRATGTEFTEEEELFFTQYTGG